MLKELNEKYEIYSTLEYEYNEGIRKFLNEKMPYGWREDMDSTEVLYSVQHMKDASYRFEYYYGGDRLRIVIFNKKNSSPKEELYIPMEDGIKFYKKLMVLENFK